jgi:hypothetical protein
MILDACYREDKPIGTALQWHNNGNLARRKIYDENSAILEEEIWNEKGHPMPLQNSSNDLYLVNATKEVKKLQSAVRDVAIHFADLREVLASSDQKLLPEDWLTSYEKDHAELQELIKQIDTLFHTLDPSGHPHTDDTKEPLWKTPAFMYKVDHEIKMISESLEKHLNHLNSWIKS